MHVDLEARVLTSDGHDVGRIKHAVVDPDSREVAAFVVSTGVIAGRDVLIARQEVESARPDGDAIRLNLSKEKFDDLPTYFAEEYSPPPAGYLPAAGHLYPDPAYLWPVPYSGASVGATVPESGPIPPEETEGDLPGVDRGARVVDSSGSGVGVVDDVVFDDDTGKLRALVVTMGGPLQRLFGAGRIVTVDASLVGRVSEGVVYLTTIREQIDANT